MDGWHQTVVVTFCASVPGDAPLVVRTNRSTKVLYVVLMVATVLLVVADVALVLLALLWSPILFVYVPLVAVQFWFVGRILREYQGLLGPQLAADHTGCGSAPAPARDRRSCTCRGRRSTASTRRARARPYES
jgi:hypothetical protein